MGLALASASGCTPDCVGVGCADRFTASELGVWRGGEISRIQGTPEATADLRVRGAEAEGRGWNPVVLAEHLLLGLPEQSEVRVLQGLLDGLDGGEQQALGEGVARLSGERTLDRFGEAMAALTFPDGRVDLWVGAPDALGPGTLVGAGALYRFRDVAGALDGTLRADVDAALRVLSEGSADALGETLAPCGDHDGDGLPELLVAAPWDASGAPLGGRVHLIGGDEPDGLPAEILAGQLAFSWTSGQEGARLGAAMACDADLDGDGRVDLALGAPFADSAGADAAGAVHLLLSGQGPQPGEIEGAAHLTLRGGSDNAWFGAALAMGDLSGDAVPELVVGAPGTNDFAGVVHVIEGEALRAGRTRARTLLSGPAARARFGETLALADLDGDGLNDLIAGAPRLSPDDLRFEAGAIYVYGGTPGLEAWPSAWLAGDADGTLSSADLLSRLGGVVSGADLDGDGVSELLWATQTEPP